jgi:hypothetical protein
VDGYGDFYRHLTGQPEAPIPPLGEVVEMPQVQRLGRKSSGAPPRVEIQEVLASPKSSPVTDPKVLATECRNPREEREALCAAWNSKKLEFEWRLINADDPDEMDQIVQLVELAKQKILHFCGETQKNINGPSLRPSGQQTAKTPPQNEELCRKLRGELDRLRIDLVDAHEYGKSREIERRIEATEAQLKEHCPDAIERIRNG